MLYFFTLLASMYAWIETLRVRLPFPFQKESKMIYLILIGFFILFGLSVLLAK